MTLHFFLLWFLLGIASSKAQACTGNYWGTNCENACDCNGQGCDAVTGTCICNVDWTGSKCDVDVDECAEGRTCPVNSHCFNDSPGFSCPCDMGFYRVTPQDNCTACSGNYWGTNCENACDCNGQGCDAVTGTCICNVDWTGSKCDVDVDECAEGRTCPVNSHCFNDSPGFSCPCDTGFYKVTPQDNCTVCPDGQWGTDCANMCQCNGQSCHSVSGSCLTESTTTALPPTETSTSTSTTSDSVEVVNACLQFPPPCSEFANCTNNFGSHNCTCKEGFTGNGITCEDNNECDDPDICGLGSDCSNIPGSYECTCRQGYHLVGKKCEDIDECSTNVHNCNNATCVNSVGSFSCNCSGNTFWNGHDCEDVDECETSAHDCAITAQCYNTFGSFVCTCLPGFTGDGRTCSQIHPCSNVPGPCESENNTYCHEYAAGPTEIIEAICIPVGYFIGNCSKNSFKCDPLADCIDEDELFHKCQCKHDEAEGNGIKTEYGGGGCQFNFTVCQSDIECSTVGGHCEKNVTQDQLFRCVCDAGYRGDGVNCTNINECEEDPFPCDEHAFCSDLPGFYECKCDFDNNYEGNGFNCTHRCYSDGDCHIERAICDNSTCKCISGYVGDGLNCTDIDECANPDLNNCHGNANCINTNGSFVCECQNGYQGDGRNCEPLPTSCADLPAFQRNKAYIIDPDFTGPADKFEVMCDTVDGVVVTIVAPIGEFPVPAPHDETPITITYPGKPTDLQPLLNASGFCYQDIMFDCSPYYALEPGTVWTDSFGNQHENFGSTKDKQCACGEVGSCDRCKCNGQQRRYSTTEKGKLIDKGALPMVSILLSQNRQDKGELTVGPLFCGTGTFSLPKNCHDAKFRLKIKNDGELYILPDNTLKSFLVECDMKRSDHVGITKISPTTLEILVTRIEGEPINYTTDVEQIEALISGSHFCSQKIEFDCQNSRVLGPDGAYVTVRGDKRRLDYFPGADHNDDKCGCGATGSCDDSEVFCNCNIDDGNPRRDFGLLIDKEDLPVVHVNAQIGNNTSSKFTLAPLECAGNQFDIDVNCEMMRAHGVEESYSYFIDPDGPGGVDPFLVECIMEKNPPQGKTVVHHTNETKIIIIDVLPLQYLEADDDQIDKLKDRSTYCTQEVSISCENFKVNVGGNTIDLKNSTGHVTTITSILESCDASGQKCVCDLAALNSLVSDIGFLTEMDALPITSVSFEGLLQQAGTLKMLVGPLICTEVFPTCAALKNFLDGPMAVVGEAGVLNGRYTIDPDGPGGVEPFTVTCTFPKTTINIGPDDGGVSPDDPNSPASTCFNISYTDDSGNPITPEQITALVQASGNCRQDLQVECRNAPVTDHVTFSTCDGKTQPGWAESFGQESCACGVTGTCDGGVTDKCNCDVADDTLRSDGGKITQTDRLPVCQVCLSIDATTVPPNSIAPPPRSLSYSLTPLVCDGDPGTSGTCQDARKSIPVTEVKVVTITSETNPPIPMACTMYPDPPIGALTVVPESPLTNPDNNGVDVEVTYVSLNITLLKEIIDKEKYCTQRIFLFGAGTINLDLGENRAWYDIDGNKHEEWKELPADGPDVAEACDLVGNLCESYNVRGFLITTEEGALPLKRLVLPGVVAIVYVDAVKCFDLVTDCHELYESGDKSPGKMGRGRWTIDPDSSGPNAPFVVICSFDSKTQQGITEVELSPQWKGTVHASNIDSNSKFELPLTYKSATPKQINGLTEVSEFCWQSVKFECKYTPLLGDSGSFYTLYDNGTPLQVPSFGTDDEIDFQGCACGLTGTCDTEGGQCNCRGDTMMGVDEGSVTDKEKLPIMSIVVAGNIKSISEVDLTVTNIRCGKKPTDPPRDCADALERGEKYGVVYNKDGNFLISPKPNSVDPFMVTCDFDFQGVPVTIIKPDIPENKPMEEPGDKVTIPYKGPDTDQILALIQRSAYCYQGVRYDCVNAMFLGALSWWQTLDHWGKNRFWGGGEPDDDPTKTGVCACGLENKCGGLDASYKQRNRRCNCDANDGELRADAGIITDKAFLPVGLFQLSRHVDQAMQVNLTIGDLICSQEPLELNECEMGFHDCHRRADCIDEVIGYRCECHDGWNGKKYRDSYFSPKANGRECINDDECSFKPCPYSANCEDTEGSYKCICKSGYRTTGPKSCVDIDECRENLHDCHPDARCDNTDGSYRCLCKQGYRGDGRHCDPVGQCSCFGDPHCVSFDNKWLHFQGQCHYILAQDNCFPGGTPTFSVVADFWDRDNRREAKSRLSWVKEIKIFIAGKVARLAQKSKIYVDGILKTAYVGQHFSVQKVNKRIIFDARGVGLKVFWNGNNMVDIQVAGTFQNNVCGLCGNYNNDASDDWEVGPSCPGEVGNVTTNYVLFGNSWTYTPPEACDFDCKPEEPTEPEVCNVPTALVEKECAELLDLLMSPFSECLVLLPGYVIDELKYSCEYDVCLYDGDMEAALCIVAENINDRCIAEVSVNVANWRQKVDSCKDPECSNNMVYKDCKPSRAESCVDKFLGSPEVENPEMCYAGCYCPEGQMMEDDECVPEDECGCFHDGEYIEVGKTIFLPNCTKSITCIGENRTKESDIVCGENEECSIEEGVVSCFCKEAYKMNDEGKCEPDNCHNVTCKNEDTMECYNGTCICKMGYIGDCNLCQDIDECAVGEHPCNRLGQECINTEGSFYCQCEPGFAQNGESCDDVDECDLGLGSICGDNSMCVNTLGNFTCSCCAGYKKNDDEDCVRDTSQDAELNAPIPEKCCACQGEKCKQPGRVCGTDGKTYSSYNALAVVACKTENEDLKQDYPGQCQPTCDTVICKKQFATCEMVDGKPKCGCPECKDAKDVFESETVCSSTKVTYISVCHMKKDTCDAEIETTVEVETVGKPCPGDGEPPSVGEWTPWGNCSEECKQGNVTRTRKLNDPNSKLHTEEYKPCYATCDNGPCFDDTCDMPGQVCYANSANETSCDCPYCVDAPEELICGRLANVVVTYDNECELKKKACEEGTTDFEVLEPRACEDKPKKCGVIRNYQIRKDDNNCQADRSINMGQCYGGCDETGELCCMPLTKETKMARMYCGDSTSYDETFETITQCHCVPTNGTTAAPVMQEV